MDNEKDISQLPTTDNENENSLDRSVQIEKIIEFYKNKETDEKTEEVFSKSDKYKRLQSKLNIIKSILITFKLKLVDLLNKIPYVKIATKKQKSDNGIETQSFGLNEKGKIILFRTISAVICIAIIALSFVLAIFLPGNDEIIAQKKDELRAEEEYVSIKTRYDELKNEVDELVASNAEKEKTLNQIADIDNTKADLRTQINEKKYELSGLNSQITEKRNEIASLDASISSKTPAETVYSPGKYTVGKHFAAGKYYVTGTGKFMVATSAGKSKINTTLSTTPVEIELENNDIVKFDSKIKLTSVY